MVPRKSFLSPFKLCNTIASPPYHGITRKCYSQFGLCGTKSISFTMDFSHYNLIPKTYQTVNIPLFQINKTPISQEMRLNIIQFVQKYIETPAHDLSSTQSVLEIWQHLQLHTQSDLSSSDQNHIDIIWNILKDQPPSYLPKVFHAFVFFIHQYDYD